MYIETNHELGAAYVLIDYNGWLAASENVNTRQSVTVDCPL
jgi:hypothetical protein